MGRVLQLAAPTVASRIRAWSSKVSDRAVPAGTLIRAVRDLEGRGALRLTATPSGSMVTAGPHTPPEEKLDPWYRFEARLVRAVLPLVPAAQLAEIAEALSTEEKAMIAAGRMP